MKFNIEVINIQQTSKPTAKGSYIQLDVAYKRLDNGKVEGKKIMSFTNKAVFSALQSATTGSQFTITSEKNENSGYWDWLSVESVSNATESPQAASSQAKAYASPKSTYETPEERAKRQVLIVRQSSLSAAIDSLKTDKKALDPTEVLALANSYVNWVFEKDQPDFVDTGFDNMEDDVPC